MKYQKLGDYFVQKAYKDEIDKLPILEKYYHSTDIQKDEFVIHKREYKVLPKIKFVRGKEHAIIISESIVERIKIPIQFTIKEWVEEVDCTKFHNDSYEVKRRSKVYDESINDFIKEAMSKYPTPSTT